MKGSKIRKYYIYLAVLRDRDNSRIEVSFLSHCETAAWEYLTDLEQRHRLLTMNVTRIGNSPHPDFVMCLN